MAMSKTIRLAFIFFVTLLIVSDVSARQLVSKPLSTQQPQSVKLNEGYYRKRSLLQAAYPDPTSPRGNGISYPDPPNRP